MWFLNVFTIKLNNMFILIIEIINVLKLNISILIFFYATGNL
jgi:hypothetical protein